MRNALGGPLGVCIGAGITLGITLLPKLFRRRGRGKKTAEEGASTPKLQANGVVFGSPVDAKNGSSKNSTGPATPLGKGRPPKALPDAFQRTSDQNSTKTAPGQDAASIQQQLQMLKAVEEENRRLKDFMNAHMQTSLKAKTLEEENQALKQLQSKLQDELEDIKAKAAAPFALTSGDELQSFKQMLATRMPLEARSVCSDAFNGLGGAPRDTAASVDGAATVADFVAARKRAPGFFQELASLLLMAPSPKPGANQSGVSAAPSGLNTPRSTYGGSALGASSPMPSRQASKAQDVHVDVGQLLESWAGGRL